MPQPVAYPSFEYSHITNATWPDEHNYLFYPGFLERFLDAVTVTPSGSEHLDPCWVWSKNATHTLSHKYFGMVPARHIAYAIGWPEDYATHVRRLRRTGKTRLRFRTVSRCSTKGCVRPDHHIPNDSFFYHAWVNKPRRRSSNHADDWLSFPELTYLRGAIRCSTGDPTRRCQAIAEYIRLEPMTVFEQWNQQCLNIERDYYSLLPIHLWPERLST